MKRKVLTIALIVSFSVLLWVFVSFSEEYSITLNLPVQVVDIPEDYSVSSISTDQVSIDLKGQGWLLAQHTLGRDPKFFIPAPTERGEKEISSKNLIGANSWLSTTLQLAGITPDKIKIKVEKSVSKKVEIVPVISLSYKPGYGLVSPIEIIPDSVTIYGPTSLVKEINIINTEGAILTNVETKSSLELNLVENKFLRIDIDKCTVNFDVQKIVDKTFEQLEVEVKSVPPRYDLILSPTKIDIILRGGINKLSKMKNSDLNALVKFEQALNDTLGTIEPIVEVPEFTSLIDVKPNRLEYIIKKY